MHKSVGQRNQYFKISLLAAFFLLMFENVLAYELNTAVLTTPQAKWQGVTLLGSAGAKTLQIDSDQLGNTVAVWVQSEAEEDNVYSSHYNASEGWTTPLLIESITGMASYPRLSMNENGEAIAVWEQYEAGGPQRLYAAHFQGDTAWSTAQRLDAQTGSNEWQLTASAVEVNENGNAFVVWCQQDTEDQYGLYARRYSPLSGWAEQQLLASLITRTRHIQIDMNARGDAVVTWLRAKVTSYSSSGRPRYTDDVYVSRYGTDGWHLPELIESSDRRPFQAQAGIDKDGNIIAVWSQEDEQGINNIYSNSFSLATGWNGG